MRAAHNVAHRCLERTLNEFLVGTLDLTSLLVLRLNQRVVIGDELIGNWHWVINVDNLNLLQTCVGRDVQAFFFADAILVKLARSFFGFSRRPDIVRRLLTIGS